VKRHNQALCALAVLLVMAGHASAESPSAETVVERAISAAEVESTLAGHDLIRAAIHQEETTSDGKSHVKDTTALIYGERLDSIRLELGNGTSLVLNGTTGWATIRGRVDDRPQTPLMAAGTIRQSLFPLLLPFSLRLEGVNLGPVSHGSFDGTSAWILQVNFGPNFFASPIMATTWRIFIDRETHLVLGAEFLPPIEYQKVANEGVRYRFLKHEAIDGLVFPIHILLDGIDLNGIENGHVRVTKLSFSSIETFDPTVFMRPDLLEEEE
jgi:hypothetical protein